MSDKKKGLLNEGTIRRFMRLAEIDKLSDGFVSGLVQEAVEEVEEGMGMAYTRDEEEAVEEAHCGTRDDELEEAADLDDAAELEDAEEEAALEAPAAEAPAAAGDAEAIFTDLVDRIIALAGEHGVEMSRDGGEAEEAAPEMDMEPAADDLEMADEPMMEDEEVPGVELEEDVDEDAMVAEITRRVTARLQQESRKESMADDLAERIMARIKESSQK